MNFVILQGDVVQLRQKALKKKRHKVEECLNFVPLLLYSVIATLLGCTGSGAVKGATVKISGCRTFHCDRDGANGT